MRYAQRAWWITECSTTVVAQFLPGRLYRRELKSTAEGNAKKNENDHIHLYSQMKQWHLSYSRLYLIPTYPFFSVEFLCMFCSWDADQVHTGVPTKGRSSSYRYSTNWMRASFFKCRKNEETTFPLTGLATSELHHPWWGYHHDVTSKGIHNIIIISTLCPQIQTNSYNPRILCH